MMAPDPMAGIGQQADPSKDDPNSTTIFNPHAHMQNLNKLDKSRTLLSIASGIGAGVLGLRSLQGFVFFSLVHCLIGVSFGVVLMGGKIRDFVGGGSWWSLVTADFQKSMLSFMFFWTFAYGLCYLF